MTITQLQYIIAVATYRNFTLAAEKCFVTQPTLSMQIQKLEEELGVELFDRTKKPIGLSKAGEKIIVQAEKIVAEVARIKDIIDIEKGIIGGVFTLGIIPTVTPTLLPLFLTHFITQYPHVQLHIQEHHTESLIDLLKEGVLDAAIAATPLEEEILAEKPMYYEPFVGYVAPEHPLCAHTTWHPSMLDTEDLLLLEDGHCFRNGILNLCRNKNQVSPPSFTIEIGSFDTLVQLVDKSMGITLLPYLTGKRLNPTQQSRLRHFNAPQPAREISLIHRKNALKEHIIDALYHSIRSAVSSAVPFNDVQIISPLKHKK